MILLLVKFWSLLAFILAPANIESEWHQVCKTKKCIVFCRETVFSETKEVKIIGKIDANFNAVIDVLTDVDSYTKWVSNCVKAYEIENDNGLYYTKIDLPYPMSDRDLIVFSENSIDENGVWHSVSIAKPYLLPTADQVVRVQNYHSNWTIINLGKNVEFEYVVSFDPGGTIPTWLMNMVITKGPMSTISALEQRSRDIMKD